MIDDILYSRKKNMIDIFHPVYIGETYKAYDPFDPINSDGKISEIWTVKIVSYGCLLSMGDYHTLYEFESDFDRSWMKDWIILDE